MRSLSLLALLALATFCLSDIADAKPSDSESDKAFVSKQEGSEVVSRPRRYLGPLGPTPDHLEAIREVCELNPTCDEQSEQIGLQRAYQRTYGTTF